MARSFKVDVKPAVLAWARKSANLRVDEVAAKLQLEEGRVREWEAGESQPTLAQLRKLGKVVRRPLAVLLIAEPPEDGQALKDFRSASSLGETSTALRFALRDAEERREIALELVGSLPDAVGAFDVSAQLDEHPEDVARRIRAALNVHLDEQLAARDAYAGLALWRRAVEGCGVLVFSFSGVDFHEARGFSLSAQPLPVVATNSKDAPSGRTFTLLHELAHIAVRSGEVLCDLSAHDTAAASTETWCNHVAGAVLVPRDALLAEPLVRVADDETEWTTSDISALARRYSVSREVIVRRLLILGKTSPDHYAEWRGRFNDEYAEYARKLDASSGGPTYMTKVVSQLGRLYPRLVLTAHDREAITTSAASGYLGVKVNHFDSLQAELRKAS